MMFAGLVVPHASVAHGTAPSVRDVFTSPRETLIDLTEKCFSQHVCLHSGFRSF